MKYLAGSILMLLTLFLACKSERNEMVNLPDDFVTFYDKFLSDSVFQVAHIRFPLEGLPSYADSETANAGDFRWTKENWILNQPFDLKNKDFDRKFRQLTENLVEEIIYQKNGQLGTVRRFLKSGNDWNLIYYSGLNAMNIK